MYVRIVQKIFFPMCGQSLGNPVRDSIVPSTSIVRNITSVGLKWQQDGVVIRKQDIFMEWAMGHPLWSSTDGHSQHLTR